MRHWIFQGNPDHFRIDDYLPSRTEVLWSVRQTHFADQMQPGDEVFIWRSAGSDSSQPAGVVAQGHVLEIPRVQSDDWPDGWIVEPPADELRVRLRVIHRAEHKKQVVKREWMKEDPVLRDLRILKKPSQTNYQITSREAQRLSLLIRNTGRDWTREESIAALWIYNLLGAGPVSKAPGSPVAETAMQIGRAVTGVYNKLMNFRAIDPTDERLKGLPDVVDQIRTREMICNLHLAFLCLRA